MRFFEFTNSTSNTEKLKNIEYILSITDNLNLLKFAEKQVEKIEGQTEAAVNNQQRIQSIVNALQQANDPKIIDYIESVLKQQEIFDRVEKVWEARGFNSGRMSKYKESFKNEVFQSPTSLRSKIELLFMLKTNKISISKSVFSQSFKGRLEDLIPNKIANNATYSYISNSIFFDDRFRGKGIGPGEFALSLLGKDGKIVDHKGDVTIEGWGIEIKDGGGGSIKTGSPTKFRQADKLRDYIGKKVGVNLDQQNKLKWDSNNEFTEKFKTLEETDKQNLITKYVTDLYPNIGTEEQNMLISGIIADIGTAQVRQHFGKALLSAYQKQDQWDCILFIKKNGELSNVTDITQTEAFLDFTLAGINRDGDTQALPDGYVNGKVSR